MVPGGRYLFGSNDLESINDRREMSHRKCGMSQNMECLCRYLCNDGS